MKKSIILFSVVFGAFPSVYSQQNDTSKTIMLKEVVINETENLSEIDRMPDVKGNVVYAGKKMKLYYWIK